MKRKSENEKGSLAIESVLGITVFMITILTIMFISLIVRVQANVQYALGQTAKEISGYYYLLDKMGFAAATTGADSKKVKDVDKTIGDVFDLAGDAESIGDNIMNIDFDDLDTLEPFVDYDYEELAEKANKIGSDLELLSKDPKTQITSILSVFAKTMSNKAMSYYIAPYVCRSVMPRYMGGDTEAANKMLEAAGVEGGMKNIDFSQSQLLTDGRSIKLVAMYKLDVSKISFGIIKSELTIRQAASTAAWIRPDGVNTKYLKDIKIGNKNKNAAKKEEEGSGAESSSSK